MSNSQRIEGVLVQWGERLFYPANRVVRADPPPRLNTTPRRKAAVIRARIEATVRRVPQVMVKVTGGGRGMGAIAAHFRYISKHGRLDIEDDRSVVRNGKEAVCDLVEQWRYGGSLIPEEGHRREAFNIMLSMPVGTNADLLQKAVREFAHTELTGHRYVMVLHEHQANPHVHLSVKAESASGKRLNPRKADLHRWRETFAEKLRGWGIEAEATRQAARGESRNSEPLWRLKAKQDSRLKLIASPVKVGGRAARSRAKAIVSWSHIMKALAASGAAEDRMLAERIGAFVRGTPVVREKTDQRPGTDGKSRQQPQQRLLPAMETSRSGPDIKR